MRLAAAALAAAAAAARAASLAPPAASQWACRPPHDAYPFCDASLPLDDRVASLVALLSAVGDGGVANLTNTVYAAPWATGGATALGVPGAVWWNEATHGATNGRGFATTFFPMPSLTACAWNLSLVRDIANVIGREGRAASNLGYAGFGFWAPNVNLVRSSLWGRAQEVPGECPTLTAQYAATYVRGLQEVEGAEPRYVQIISTVKHLAVYSFEGFYNSPVNRMNFDAAVSEQDLGDTYLVPFQAAFTQGGALGAMCSYTAINGVPACANRWLLTQVLQQAWGFRGYVTGDCGAVQNVNDCAPTARCHNYTHSNSSTVAAVLAAGATMDCGDGFTHWMPAAVADGSVALADLAAAAARNLRVRFRAGVFDDPAGQPMARWGNESVCTPAAAALSLRAAEEGMVLLKNALAASGLGLPLAPARVRRLALIGGNANDTLMQLCSYYSTPCGGFEAMVSPLAALTALVPQLDYALGCDAGCSDTGGFAAAAAAAAAGDATVLALGLNCKITGEGVDRGTLTLPGHQDALAALACAAARGRPCVALLFAGASLDVSALLANPNVTAVLYVGYGGPSGGTAVARALFGAAAPPAGRLTTTWLAEAGVAEVAMQDMRMRPGPSAFPPGTTPGRTYRFYAGNATLLPFGFGLSLTTWRYSPPQGPAALPAAAARNFAAAAACGGGAGALAAPLDSPTLGLYAVNVTNTGTVDSDDVVLGFLVPPGAGTGGLPLTELLGFQRVHVPAGATTTVWLGVRARDLTVVGADGCRRALPGAWLLRVGVEAPARLGALTAAAKLRGGPPLAALSAVSSSWVLVE